MWPYLVLTVFIVGFTVSMILFLSNNYADKEIPWWTYAFTKVTQLITVIVMFMGFEANVNKED